MFSGNETVSIQTSSFFTNRLSIWMRENVNRRLQTSRSFPLLESILADWPIKSQMRLTNQTKASFVDQQ